MAQRIFYIPVRGFLSRLTGWLLATAFIIFAPSVAGGPSAGGLGTYRVEASAIGDNLGQAAPLDSASHPQCGLAATKIHRLQGDGASSPLLGTRHTLEAVVVGDFQGRGALNGFFLQQRDGEQDDNPATSEGIFVYQGRNTQAVQRGDLVRVSGTVREYFGMTQLNAQSVHRCASGLSVSPAILSLPIENLNTLERLEGMAVVVPQELTVTGSYQLGRFGELLLSASGRLYSPTQVAAPGVAAQAVAEDNRLRSIVLDDGSGRKNPSVIAFPPPQLTADNSLRAGETVRNLRGVLHFAFDQYRIQPTEVPQFLPTNPRKPLALPKVDGLTIATFNLSNYFNGDGRGRGFPTSRGADSLPEFQRQRAKIMAALVAIDADIVGLEEIENDGYGPTSAIADLIKGLADAGLAYRFVDPGVTRLGGDEITVGFIYKPATAIVRGDSAILDKRVDARFNDGRNRPVLAQTFADLAGNSVITLAVTHFKSKGSHCNDLGDPDTGDGQGNCNRTRAAAAAAMVDWLADDPTESRGSDVLILGDINAYAKEDPVKIIEAAGYHNLVAKHLGENAYTHLFASQAGTLDYALASPSLAAKVTAVVVWPINADEPRVLDYNTEFKTSEQVKKLYSRSPWRSSDHDPVIVQLDLKPSQGARLDRLVDAASLFGWEEEDIKNGNHVFNFFGDERGAEQD